MKRLSLIIFLFVFILPCEATEYLCRNVSLDEGLSQSSVTALTSDRRGFLWIGTRFGLNRYDFERVENYYREPVDPNSLPDNDVRALFTDSHGTLWVACARGTAQRNDKENNFKHITIDNRPLNVRSFYEEDDGLLLGGGGVIYYYDFATGSVTPLQTKGGSQYYYTHILSRGNDFYILATRWDGLWLYDRLHATVKRMEGFDEAGIMACCIDSRGILWVSPYGQGVTAYDRAGTALFTLDTSNSALNSNIILDIAENDGKIWFATDGGGICIFDPQTQEFDNSESQTALKALGSVTCLYSDEANNIYAGTGRYGAATVRRVGIHSFHGSDKARYAVVTSLLYDTDGTLWLGDDGNGVLKYTSTAKYITNLKPTEGMKVTDIAVHDGDNVLAATFDRGFVLINKRTGAVSKAPEALQNLWLQNTNRAIPVHLRTLAKNIIAIITDHVTLYNPSSGTIEMIQSNADSRPSEALVPFSSFDGRLLCFSQQYITEFDPVTRSQSVILNHPDKINCAAYDGNSKIYVGTEKGILCHDLTTNLTAEMPDMPGRASAIACESPDRLWIATTRTIYLKQLDTDNMIGFGVSDGVNPNEYLPNATLVVNGRILFGGAYGLVRIDTKEIKALANETNTPTPTLADIKINGVSVYNRIDDGLLRVPEHRTSASLSVIDRGSNAHHSRYYRYFIRGGGHDRTIQTFSRSLDLNFLEPGNEYQISIAGQRPDGSWSEPDNLVTLAVMAPWFKSPWTMAIIVLIFIGGYTWWEIYRSRRRKTIISTEMENYRRDTLERELSFLVNTNYALRTPLTLIYAPLKLLIERLRNGEQADVIASLEGIYQNTKKMRDSIDMALELHSRNEKVTDTDLTTHDVSRSIDDVMIAVAPEFKKKHIECVYLPSQDMFPALYNRTRLAGAITILLRNAIQRSDDGSKIRISAEMHNGKIRVSIADTGTHLDDATLSEMFTKYFNADPSELGNSLGFAYAKNIIDLHGGETGAFNNKNAPGITVWFEMPGAGKTAYEAYTRRRNREESMPLKELEAVVADIDTSELTVIVAEEDEDLCNFITMELSADFRKAVPVRNGKDALMMIRQYQPDIVITSVMLPGLSGLELCHALKKSPDTRHIPVILLTDLREGSAIEHAYGAGADSYLSKPFDMPILLTRCRNLLHNRSAIRERYAGQATKTEKQTRALSNADETFMLKIDRIITDNLANPDLGVDLVVRHMATSRSALYIKFKEIMGKSIGAYIADRRFLKATELLADAALSVSEISEQLGFSSQRYFSTFFKERSGTTPSAYRANLKNQPQNDN